MTLVDRALRRRCDVWLGKHGTPESRAKYQSIIGDYGIAFAALPEPRRPARVPEPASVVFLAAGAALVLRHRRSVRK